MLKHQHEILSKNQYETRLISAKKYLVDHKLFWDLHEHHRRDSDSDSVNDRDPIRLKRIRNLSVQNMEIQNLLLPKNSNNIHNNNNNKDTNCYRWNNKRWIGTKPENPLFTECGLKKCIECKNEK